MNPDTLDRLSAAAVVAVVALIKRWQAGELTDIAFTASTLAALGASQSQGVALADLALATSLTASRGVPVPTLGLSVDDQASSRAVDAVREIMAAVKEAPKADWEVQLAEFYKPVEAEVRDTVQLAAQKASGRALRGHKVKGWTRVLDAGACPVCSGLAASVDPEGLPATTDMYRHTGCGCTQAPVE